MAAETIETLLDSWVNGNRSHVVGMFGHASRGEVTEFVGGAGAQRRNRRRGNVRAHAEKPRVTGPRATTTRE